MCTVLPKNSNKKKGAENFGSFIFTSVLSKYLTSSIFCILYLFSILMANNSVAPLDDCNVFVKYLPSDLSDQDFYKLFSPFGEIISSKIMVDQSTGKSLGYG
jgi:hypothetical protein